MKPKKDLLSSFRRAGLAGVWLLVSAVPGAKLLTEQPVKAAALQPASSIVLSEDFEDGLLDERFSQTTTGTFSDPPGIKATAQTGSTKAFGFGRSTCGSSCFGNFTTKLTITFPAPTFISAITFKTMELYGNWGSFAWLYIDGQRISAEDEFGRRPDNSGVPDSAYRTRGFSIDDKVSTINLYVWDITSSSEIFIDDLLITAAPCATPPSGIHSWWSGDGHTFDIMGDNDGTLNNGTAYVQGIVGRAFDFDGINDYVRIPNSPDLQTIGDHFTIEAWVKPDSLPSGDAYYDQGIVVREGYAKGFALMTKGSAFGLWIGDGSLPVPYALSVPITAGHWYHVVGTYDGTTARIYVNGDLQGTQAASLVHYDNPVTISSTAGGERFIHGQIDEVLLYNRTLSDAEVLVQYEDCPRPPQDMVLYWPFDEIGGTNADEAVGGYDGTLTNGPTWASGKVGGALSFDGVDDYVSLPDGASALLDNAAGTISVWTLPVEIGNDILVAFGNMGFCPGSGLGIGITNEVRPWHCYGSTDWDSTTPVTVNRWVHLAFAWDSTTEYIYKNGYLMETRPRNFSYVAGQARVGDGFWGGGNKFAGLIDEVKVFGRTLSGREILADAGLGCSGKCRSCMDPPEDLLSWWHFQQGSGDTVSDFMGEHPGTLHGPLWSTGKVGAGLMFDGADDYVAVADSPDWDLGSADFTIGAWIKTDGPQNTMRLISAGYENSEPNEMWGFGYGSNSIWGIGNRLNFFYYSGSNIVNFNSDLIELRHGTWNMIGVSRSGEMLTFYLNGTQVGSRTIGTAALGGGTAGVLIGARRSAMDTLSEFAGGLIDEVELYARALSAAEFAALHSSGCAGKCTPDLIHPTVVSITRLDSDPTNQGSLDFEVTFSEALDGVDISDFTLEAGGTISGQSVSAVTDSGDQTTYTVTISSGTGDGTLRLILPVSASAADLAGNPLSGLPYSLGESYSVDKTAPEVASITRLDPSPSFEESVDYEVVFSEAVGGLDATDFDQDLTGELLPQPVGPIVDSGDHMSYTVSVSTGTGSGTMRLNVHSSSDVEDLAGNPLTNLPFQAGEIYEIRISDVFLPLIVR